MPAGTALFNVADNCAVIYPIYVRMLAKCVACNRTVVNCKCLLIFCVSKLALGAKYFGMCAFSRWCSHGAVSTINTYNFFMELHFIHTHTLFMCF